MPRKCYTLLVTVKTTVTTLNPFGEHPGARSQKPDREAIVMVMIVNPTLTKHANGGCVVIDVIILSVHCLWSILQQAIRECHKCRVSRDSSGVLLIENSGCDTGYLDRIVKTSSSV